LDRRREASSVVWVVVLLCAAPFMVVLDSNLVAIALPSIGRDLGFEPGGLQWVVGAYSLAFGGGLLVGGRAADLYGRRRVLVFGLVLFSTASCAGALAPSRPVLLAARALQGLGAAAAFPASLALIASLFEPGRARDRALGVYGAVVSAAFVSGMLVGGLLTAWVGWRSTLLVNCPIGVCAALAAHRLAPETRPAAPGDRLGLPGAVAASAAALTLLYGIGATSPEAIAAAALLAGAAWRIERRSPAPLLSGALIRNREVVIAVLAALLTVGTGVGVVFTLTLHLQDALGHDPIAAGLLLSPLGVAGVASGLVTSRIAAAAGLVRTLTAALLVQAAGAAVLITAGIELVLIGTALLGLGHFGATIAFTSLAAGNDAERGHGASMGLVGSAQQIGGALGLAVLVAVGTVTGFQGALAAGAGMSLLAAALVFAVSGGPRPARGRRPAREWRTTHRRDRAWRRPAAPARRGDTHGPPPPGASCR
jgi:MFS family permease